MSRILMLKQKDLAIKIKMSETKQPLQKKINEQDHKKIIEEIRYPIQKPW